MATIVTRSGKGSPLTNTEVDANFTNLNTDKVELTNLSVSSASASGGGSLSYANGSGVFTYTPPDLTGKQAASAKLTDISALAVTNSGFIVGDGSNFVLESGATVRTSLGLGTMAVAATGSYAAVANNLSDLANAGTARTNLGLAIGTNVQAYDAQLADVAGLAVTDGNFIVGNGSNFVAESGATVRASLGLTIGTNVQAYDAQLADIAGLTPTNSNFIVGDGSNFVAESGATARTSLGLAIGTNVLAYDSNLQSFVTAFTLPTSDGSSGQALTTNGSATLAFSDVDALPSQSGNSGEFLTTNGTVASWAEVDSLPSQSGNSGKFLTTNGSAASWGAVGNHADGGFSNSTYLALQSIDGGSASG
jgi:hypothetical protein